MATDQDLITEAVTQAVGSMTAALADMVRGAVETAITKELAALRTELTAVHEAITGNGLGTHTGLIGRVAALEAADSRLCDKMDGHLTDFDEHKRDTREGFRRQDRRWDRIRWLAIGAAFGSGGGLVFLIQQIVEAFR